MGSSSSLVTKNEFICLWVLLISNMYCVLFVAMDHCHYSPCFNNGTCQNFPDKYTCDCMAGFTGRSCESEYHKDRHSNFFHIKFDFYLIFFLTLWQRTFGEKFQENLSV